ncbi:sensor histidine kinase [Nisaea nitritireducens]|uniref:sensor histidine kinase n=1 Tax=Nisaea nitritireducens TaxID=568392 RepID=UPI0029BFBE01|nr:sensor histidine kinase [Nisaea nitritireducens]
MTLPVEHLTWQKGGQNEADLRDHLVRALIRSGVCVTLQDASLDYLFIANLPDCWSVLPAHSPRDEDMFGPEIGAALTSLKTDAITQQENQKQEMTVGQNQFFEFNVELLVPTHNPALIMTTIVDLTEERRRERTLKALLRELSHRSKNLLAIIQSIATQTARHSGTLDSFLTKFRGRLYSLSQSQDLITDSSWTGARFRDLASQQIEKYVSEDHSGITVEGDDPWLSPNEALHVGLALHELIVNAASHGGASKATAPVTLICDSTLEGARQQVSIRWHETRPESEASNAEAEQQDGRFGSIVLERVVPNAVNGVAHYRIAADHVAYDLTFTQENPT